jgi:CRP/FNR family transcriptional regulator, anaerobic regulatory protein
MQRVTDRIAVVKLPCHACPGRSMGICAPLDFDRLAELLSLGEICHWNKGDRVFQAGQRMGRFYKIIKGIVAVHTTLSDGRHQILSLNTTGEVCGYLENEGTYQFTGDAVTDVEACAFDRGRFNQLEARYPDLAKAIEKEMSARLKRTAETLTAIGQLKAPERLAYFLLQLTDIYADRFVATSAVLLPLTREQIGHHLGMTLETVSRCFGLLKKRELILESGDTVTIPDRARLEQFAVLATPIERDDRRFRVVAKV